MNMRGFIQSCLNQAIKSNSPENRKIMIQSVKNMLADQRTSESKSDPKDSMDLNCTNGHGNTLLILAVLENRIDIIPFLLENGANPNQPNIKNGATPLAWAAQNNNIEIADLLLKNGADINQGNKKTLMKTKPLSYAIMQGHVDMTIFLLAQGADLQYLTEENSPCDRLIKAKNYELLAILLQSGLVLSNSALKKLNAQLSIILNDDKSNIYVKDCIRLIKSHMERHIDFFSDDEQNHKERISIIKENVARRAKDIFLWAQPQPERDKNRIKKPVAEGFSLEEEKKVPFCKR